MTALSRSPGDEPLPDGIRTVAGDVTEYDSIESAFAGQDAVVNLVALSPLFTPAGGNEQHERVHLGGTRNVVRAVEAHDVERLIQLSALGADPDGATAYIRAKGAAERVVQEAALDWVIVRPSVVFGDGGEFIPFTKLLTTPYLTGLPGGGATMFQPIWVGDLVSMLVDAVEDDRHVGSVYELGGPDTLTLADVAKQVYHTEGRPCFVLPIPMAVARLGLTVGEKLPGFPMGADQFRSLQFDNTVSENDIEAFGQRPSNLRTLEGYLTERSAAADAKARSSWMALSTLALFGLLGGGWLLPTVVDIYSYGGLPRLAFLPSYLVSILTYDGGLGLERVASALAPAAPVDGGTLWTVGLFLTFYLVAVLSTWFGRRLRVTAVSIQSDGDRPGQDGESV